MQEIKKIVIIGPESTGKSTLCSRLAAHYHTAWCREYAREYLLQHGTNYTFEDLLTIAKGQLALEDSCMVNGQRSMANYEQQVANPQPAANNPSLVTSNPQLLFIDTDMYVMKVWCEYVFGKCHPFILDEIVARKYDLYLLCKPDIAWVKDELREYPDERIRIELYHIYKDLLLNQPVPWVEINGDYERRLQTAVSNIDDLLFAQPSSYP